jgi:deoxyribodipyrimidine photo-lyase
VPSSTTPSGSAAVVIFTRDLRVRDHPALVAAVRDASYVTPAFVFDDRILTSGFAGPNRVGFLLDALDDLDRSLREMGGALVVRKGDWVDEVVALTRASGATVVHASDDVSGYARARFARLEAALERIGASLRLHPGVTVVPAGEVVPAGRDHYAVFTPYFRRWSAAPWRSIVAAPRALQLPAIEVGGLPSLDELSHGERATGAVSGGELAARSALNRWTRTQLAEYGQRRDDLPGDATSHLSAHLHFGCISPLEVATKLRGRAGADPFVRQLCWRDFFHQVLAARPDAAWTNYRGSIDWDRDEESLLAWREGRTGYPVVDAGLRQLLAEGFMHNRARLVVASFLTKDLRLDWRDGARHFLAHLVDGDLASNNLSWQWVAGTGTDTNPHRIFNPTRQGERFDPEGEYVRRYVPELRSIGGGAVHDPGPIERRTCGYPDPVVDHHAAIGEYRARARA